jgi:hypothetical protein
MLFIFSISVLIRHLWQLKTVVFMHWCLICVVLLVKPCCKTAHNSNFCPTRLGLLGWCDNKHEQPYYLSHHPRNRRRVMPLPLLQAVCSNVYLCKKATNYKFKKFYSLSPSSLESGSLGSIKDVFAVSGDC